MTDEDGSPLRYYNRLMNVSEITAQIDLEIARLQQARKLLAGFGDTSDNTPFKQTEDAPTRKRALSPDARARIVAAQKKRWAAQRQAAKKATN